MKRNIKIKFVDFWSTCDYENHILTRALRENFDVEIVNDDSADYVFFSVFGNEHWFLPNRCIKIFYTGENICPDFNACDYAIGFERLDYGDRYIRIPNYYCTPHFLKSTMLMEKRNCSSIKDTVLLNRKFCCHVVSQSSGNPTRLRLFEELSKYKTVDSGGRWSNNVGGPVDDKIEFQKQYKFCIAGENASHSGYTTEKIVEAFASNCVPIYWGDPDVVSVFNPKSFINANEIKNLKELVERVKLFNENDELYLEMLRSQILLHPESDSYEVVYNNLVRFLNNIVSVPLQKAYRRGRDEWGQNYIDKHKSYINNISKSSKQLLIDVLKNKFLKTK